MQTTIDFQTGFHNTIQCQPEELIVYNTSALSQEKQVLEVFNRLNKPLAWFEVANLLDMNEVSLKRSISNLSTKGKLVKDTRKENMKLSPAGKPCHLYQLIKK